MLSPEFLGTSDEEAPRTADPGAATVFLVVVPQQWPPDERRHALREHPSGHRLRTQIRALCGTSVIVPFPTVPRRDGESSTTEPVIDCEHCEAAMRERGYCGVVLESG
ncbi:hypothetical protein [Actinopolyspora erythraea]|uniref:hypothetical protein n=1 Tax=Actinopolyspora erythraea TaxID=414996 RepID=UPI001185780A|nr:hypothetical protein [Actinopolyspora erythraea]